MKDSLNIALCPSCCKRIRKHIYECKCGYNFAYGALTLREMVDDPGNVHYATYNGVSLEKYVAVLVSILNPQ